MSNPLLNLSPNSANPINALVADVAQAMMPQTSPYAMDLIARAPKHKFMFIVQFTFNAGYTYLSEVDPTFVVKKSTRPNVRCVYEDVNYYNFRTKVPTKTTYEDMSMSFHDDNLNTTNEFFRAYLNATSPVSNGNKDHTPSPQSLSISGMDFAYANVPMYPNMPSAGVGTNNAITNAIVGAQQAIASNSLTASLLNQQVSANILKKTDLTSGMVHQSNIPNEPSNAYSASRGVLNNDNTNVFSTITVYHVYDYGQSISANVYVNPKITEMSMDEFDMSEGTSGSEITFKFNYDTVYIINDQPLSAWLSGDEFPGNMRGAMYPLKDMSGSTAGALANVAGVVNSQAVANVSHIISTGKVDANAAIANLTNLGLG